ncbi:uncharacterized protein LOC123292077 [Chrysoperla carnea]|uniref:uncharacterized protein LOC123292077 n=1 Tax=Chrysoperla carnea TaxID=189513 RepID=UPI001D075B04|nr:uncharacterized protein LOC123292077 [Chrysoperla carnea]
MYQFLIIVSLISLFSINCVHGYQGSLCRQSDNGQQIIYNGQSLSMPYFPGTTQSVIPYGYARTIVGRNVPTNPVINGQPQFLYPGMQPDIYAPQYGYKPGFNLASGFNPANNGQSLLLSALQQPMPNANLNQQQSISNIRYPTQYEYIPTNMNQNQVPIYNNQVPIYNNQVPIHNQQVPIYYNPYPGLQSQQPLKRSIDVIPMEQAYNPWSLTDDGQTGNILQNVMELNNNNNNNNTSQGDENEAVAAASENGNAVHLEYFPISEPLDFSGFKNFSLTDLFLDKGISFESDIFNICARCEEAATKCEITDKPKDENKIDRTRVCKTSAHILSSISKEIPNPNHTKENSMHTVVLA